MLLARGLELTRFRSARSAQFKFSALFRHRRRNRGNEMLQELRAFNSIALACQPYIDNGRFVSFLASRSASLTPAATPTTS